MMNGALLTVSVGGAVDARATKSPPRSIPTSVKTASPPDAVTVVVPVTTAGVNVSVSVTSSIECGPVRIWSPYESNRRTTGCVTSGSTGRQLPTGCVWNWSSNAKPCTTNELLVTESAGTPVVACSEYVLWRSN